MFSAIQFMLALGAAAVFLCLPNPGAAGRRWRIAGLILGVGVLAGLAGYLIRWLEPGFEGRTFFVVFSCLAVVAAVRVISHPRPVYSALYFVMVVLSVTALCILASAEFLGIALVIVYAGAILVTYVFVIMLAQQSGTAGYDRRAREPFAAVAIGFILAAATAQSMHSPSLVDDGPARPVLRLAATGATGPKDASTSFQGNDQLNTIALSGQVGNVRAVGASLMTSYAVALEVAGVLLLVAMVGAIAIAQKTIEPEALTPAERHELASRDDDVHRFGRQAPPF
jgi:NADH-quinone oxidoreductase subunit J